MARAAVLGRLSWQLATVVKLVDETPRVRSIVLDPPQWQGQRAGQHVDVRLTAEDGYQAQRSYSIASAPEDEHLVLTVERLDDGEVSPYLVDELRPDDELELRGPVGGYFVWEESLGGPLLLIGGGSGVVPLRAMLRHHKAIGSSVPVRLLYSTHSLDEAICHRRHEIPRRSGSSRSTRAVRRFWGAARLRTPGSQSPAQPRELTSLLVEALLLSDGAQGRGNRFEPLIGNRLTAFDRETISPGGKPLLGVLNSRELGPQITGLPLVEFLLVEL